MPASSPEQIAASYPWLPPEVIEVYTDAWAGGSVDPWSDVRADTRYDQWFPGNRTPDGRVRYGESQYAAVRESYRDVVRSMNLNPELFEERFTELMEGEVSPAEFEARADQVWNRIATASDQIRQRFADANGFDLTTEGLLASALDPDLGDDILNQRITLAEVGGAAAESGFNVADTQIDQLVRVGVGLDEARQLYQRAESLLPALDILTRRHNDPDDDFSLDEFTNAQVFQDPTQNRRIRRLMDQERATFGTGLSARQLRGGAVTGLEVA